MTDAAPNVSTLWGRVLVDELVAAGVSAACVAPGSRSTPLVLAFVENDNVTVYSHLDERSAAYFALGRAKRSGRPTAVVCTSGTAAANFHPAVIEADRSRTPMIVCTADRPPELSDSGANQTIDQEDLYANAVRWQRTLPEPGVDARKLRSLRVSAVRAVAASTGIPAGPVHLNVPFEKPLEPSMTSDNVPPGFVDAAPLGALGRGDAYVTSTRGRTTIPDAEVARIVEIVREADRGLVVAGPADPVDPSGGAGSSIASLAEAADFPLLADPLSGLRFGAHVDATTTCGGYDGYLDPASSESWPDPDLVIRFGASPTSKVLREYLERTAPRQLVVDPAGEWREATFTATDLIEADPRWLTDTLASRLGGSTGRGEHGQEDGGDEGVAWIDRFRRAEASHWNAVNDESRFFEGAILAAVVEEASDPSTVFVSNSMPVRDLDRFGRPSTKELTVLGNRGASGIDGITSTALGAGSATDEPLVLVTGDLAYYHDMNGLLAISRCRVNATIVVIDNGGGGIFHMLPIAEHDAFEEWFQTPHGLDFEPTADLYDLGFASVDSVGGFNRAYRDSIRANNARIISVESDAKTSFDVRDELADRVASDVRDV